MGEALKPNTLGESIKSCIDAQLADTTDDELESTRIWLRGWACGVTDPLIHPKHSGIREKDISSEERDRQF